jgi:hypothetical protein
MNSSKSREHRVRVLENLAKVAGERGVAPRAGQGDAQMRMPLVVEVKGGTGMKQRGRRGRGGTRKDQPELGEL